MKLTILVFKLLNRCRGKELYATFMFVYSRSVVLSSLMVFCHVRQLFRNCDLKKKNYLKDFCKININISNVYIYYWNNNNLYVLLSHRKLTHQLINYVHLYTVYPSSEGCFQQDNAPKKFSSNHPHPLKDQTISNSFLEHGSQFTVATV